MAGILTKGIKFSAGTASGSLTEVTGLQECPAMGGAADKVDVTTLADANYKYINGIKDFGDLEFTFLYDNSTATSNYRVLKSYETAEEATPGTVHYFSVEFPDGTKFAFSGQISVATSAGAVNGAIQFTATINLNSDIVVTNPSAASGNN